MPEWFFEVSAWVLPVIIAITMHEAAHGWMAEKFGDPTARLMGRVTINPLKHVDKFGTIIFPGILLLMQSPFLFGYAKPVPVNFYQLKPPRIGMAVVALAGPGTNVLLALASALLLHVVSEEELPWLYLNLQRSILINCILAVFNMIPILPLDGGRVVDSMLRGRLQRAFHRFERYGIVIVLAVFIGLPLLGYTAVPELIAEPIYMLVRLVLLATGNHS